MSRKRLSWPRIVEQAGAVVAGYDGVVTVRQVLAREEQWSRNVR